MAANAVQHKLRLWAAAIAGDQVNRRVSTGTERIDQMPDIVMLGVGVMRVEMVVQRMESIGRWKEARVLRTEYFMAGLSEVDRLARLARMGLKISRASYYAYLTSARAFVEGALSQGEVMPASSSPGRLAAAA